MSYAHSNGQEVLNVLKTTTSRTSFWGPGSYHYRSYATPPILGDISPALEHQDLQSESSNTALREMRILPVLTPIFLSISGRAGNNLSSAKSEPLQELNLADIFKPCRVYLEPQLSPYYLPPTAMDHLV